jgi:hypothetical protein
MFWPMKAAGKTPGRVAAVARPVIPAPAFGAKVLRNFGAAAVFIASVIEGLGPRAA